MLRPPLRERHALGYARGRNVREDQSSGSPGEAEVHWNQSAGTPLLMDEELHWTWCTGASHCTVYC